MQEIKLHSRVKFPEGKQKEFLEQAMSSLSVGNSGLAKIACVCDRTLRDWKREKYNISFLPLFSICHEQEIGFPKDIEVRPPYWSVKKAGKLGGKRYIALYGAPGTTESRRKGGLKSQEKFRLDPEHARKVGFILRKQIKHPNKSALFAEFIGIMLGDGGVSSDYQITVSFNGREDQDYAIYIQGMIKKLFDIASTMRIKVEEGRANIVATGKNLVKFLEKMGIKKGDKVKNQVDIPSWIFQSKIYQKACLRGLFDTDGCVYKHRYKVAGKEYSYLKMSFRNYSIPLLQSIKRILENLNFHPVISVKHQTVYINRAEEVKKYFSQIDTSNPRYRKRFIAFLENKSGGVCEVAETSGLLSR